MINKTNAKIIKSGIYASEYHQVNYQIFDNGLELSLSLNKEKGTYSLVVFAKNKIMKDFGENWSLHNLPKQLTKAYKFCGFSYTQFIRDIRERNKKIRG